ncbi:hypothetical protein [Thauera sp.]|uniref:hypothetical protein n=1 Tax=Thauera sp. TaxID=1905334 RepID=UPI00257AC443|nr:hypothetical protein [Thauera sp.]
MTKAERILAECKRRGLTVTRTGKAWHISGNRVDVRVANLEDVSLEELNPANWCSSSALHK